MRQIRLLFFCAIGIAFSPHLSYAAGFLVPDIGTKAMSRGGAFIASGDDLTSLWYNPANLSKLRGLQVLLDGAIVWIPYSFERDKSADSPLPYPRSENAGPPQPIPFIAVSYDFGFLRLPQMHNLTLAVGLWAPYDGNYYFDKSDDGQVAQPVCRDKNQTTHLCNTNGPQRYSLLRYDPIQAYIGIALAYGLDLGFFKLRVGGGFQLVQTEIFQSLVVQLVPTSTSSTTSDASLTIKAADSFRPAGNVGLQMELGFGLSIGASFQFPLDVTMKGTLQAELPTAFKDVVSLEGDEVTVKINLPWFLRTGIAYQPTFFPRFVFEVSFVYEAWSSFQQILLDPSKIAVKSPFPFIPSKIEPIGIPRQWQDAWSIRAGGQIEIIPRHLFFRAGYYYETSAIPSNRFNVSAIHGERHGLGLGVEGRWKAGPVEMALALSYSHVFQADLVVKNSEERVIVLTQTEEDRKKNPPEVVGNGVYRGQVDILLLSFSLKWDHFEHRDPMPVVPSKK